VILDLGLEPNDESGVPSEPTAFQSRITNQESQIKKGGLRPLRPSGGGMSYLFFAAFFFAPLAAFFAM
jgi:hypothetical protein